MAVPWIVTDWILVKLMVKKINLLGERAVCLVWVIRCKYVQFKEAWSGAFCCTSAGFKQEIC